MATNDSSTNFKRTLNLHRFKYIQGICKHMVYYLILLDRCQCFISDPFRVNNENELAESQIIHAYLLIRLNNGT
jgi:hypothetical protein